MAPVNQVILGNPLLSGEDFSKQLELMKQYEAKLQGFKYNNSIWSDIDKEIEVLSDEQKKRLSEDSNYVSTVESIQKIIQEELLNLVKDKVAARQDGKELLDKQLNLVKVLKEKIISETNNEMELFKKFKEASKNNPSLTYENFCKRWANRSV